MKRAACITVTALALLAEGCCLPPISGRYEQPAAEQGDTGREQRKLEGDQGGMDGQGVHGRRTERMNAERGSRKAEGGTGGIERPKAERVRAELIVEGSSWLRGKGGEVPDG